MPYNFWIDLIESFLRLPIDIGSEFLLNLKDRFGQKANHPMTASRFVITGRVQGVSFRAATQREASRLGLTGWVRNLPTGQVECFAQGEKTVVQKLAAWLHNGPPHAQVTGVDEAPSDPDTRLSGFQIRVD